MDIAERAFHSRCIDKRTIFLLHFDIEGFLLHTEIQFTISVSLLSPWGERGGGGGGGGGLKCNRIH